MQDDMMVMMPVPMRVTSRMRMMRVRVWVHRWLLLLRWRRRLALTMYRARHAQCVEWRMSRKHRLRMLVSMSNMV